MLVRADEQVAAGDGDRGVAGFGEAVEAEQLVLGRQFLQSPRILERADDDRTLLLAVPVGAV